MQLLKFDKNKITMERAATSKEKPRVNLTPNLSAVELNIICKTKQKFKFRRRLLSSTNQGIPSCDQIYKLKYNMIAILLLGE